MTNSDRLLREIADHVFEGMFVVDKDRRVLLWNREAEQITGFERSEVVGGLCHDNGLEHADDTGCVLCHADCPLLRTLQDDRTTEERVYIHHKSGHRLPVRVRNVPVHDNGRVVAAVQLFHDLTAEVEKERRISELEALSRTDALTRLPNRMALESIVRRRLDERRRYGTPVALAIMDVDRFKQINDTHGHGAGDLVLQSVASTLRRNVRLADTVGRWGGDEFVAILPNIDMEGLARILDRLRALAAASQVKVAHTTVGVSLSMGATLAEESDTFQTILTRADRLLYESKDGGRNRVTIR